MHWKEDRRIQSSQHAARDTSPIFGHKPLNRPAQVFLLAWTVNYPASSPVSPKCWDCLILHRGKRSRPCQGNRESGRRFLSDAAYFNTGGSQRRSHFPQRKPPAAACHRTLSNRANTASVLHMDSNQCQQHIAQFISCLTQSIDLHKSRIVR
jgi:hypothetical protein